MEKAPFFDDIAQGPPGGQAHWVTASDGVRLRLGLWPAKTGAAHLGTVLLFPGRTEYIEKYGPIATELVTAGYHVLTIDWRGQGLSPRGCRDQMIGHVGGFGEFQRDVAALHGAVQKLGLPTPLFLLSHSMGGCIALRALHDGLAVNAAVFSAPMWGISLSKALRPAAWASSWFGHSIGKGCSLAPGTDIESYVTVAPFDDNQLTTDADMYALMQAQAKARPELILGGPSLSWLYSALRETRALAQMPAPQTPCLTYLGTQERIVDPAPIHAQMQKWDTGQLEMIEGAEHEVLLEKPDTRARVYAGLNALFAQHRG